MLYLKSDVLLLHDCIIMLFTEMLFTRIMELICVIIIQHPD